MQKIGSFRAVNPYNPWLAMWIAITRKAKYVDQPVHPEEALTRALERVVDRALRRHRRGFGHAPPRAQLHADPALIGLGRRRVEHGGWYPSPALETIADAAAEPALDADATLAAAFTGARAVYAMIPPDYATTDPQGHQRRIAEAYVRQAPAAIDTPYRRMIAEQLGWHHRS